MDLLSSFRDFIAARCLFTDGNGLLLAVSGGLDSSVLCELCYRAGYDFAIAHCNFQLRGEESDRDERFVRQLATRYSKDIFVQRFDTEQYAAAGKLSVQVAARELRYSWFQEIAGLRKVVTGHHLDDNIETLLMNFFKGTGIAGLRAMLPGQGGIERPLLFATREQLYDFAKEHGLSWVEDSSNQSDKYSRNYVRHQLIPVVQNLYPGAMENLAANIDRFREIEFVYQHAIGQQIRKLVKYRGEEVHIPVLFLKKSEPLVTLVHEIITRYGFSSHQTKAVIELLDSSSGKYVASATHRILKDRRWLILSPLRTEDSKNILVESADQTIPYENGALRLEALPIDAAPADLAAASATAGSKTTVAGKHPGTGQSHQPTAWLDAGLIEFPLLLRRWRAGDYFYPLGMRKKKKLSRFFIDNKLSLADKEKVWVLEMDKKIIWAVGLRIDDRFRITPSTTQVLKVETGMF